MQTMKPRARYNEKCDMWLVWRNPVGDTGFPAVFAKTLTEGLHIWYQCALIDQVTPCI